MYICIAFVGVHVFFCLVNLSLQFRKSQAPAPGRADPTDPKKRACAKSFGPNRKWRQFCLCSPFKPAPKAQMPGGHGKKCILGWLSLKESEPFPNKGKKEATH